MLGSIPLFMLYPGRYERSVISLHLPVLCPFGMMPNLLMWIDLNPLRSTNGPSMRPSSNSFLRYSDIGSGCFIAENMFDEASFRGVGRTNPILKPNCRPVQIYSANALSGWVCRVACHLVWWRGDETRDAMHL